ncbi:MAG TPA: nuclear transport factor 2 family protein [Candidatus Methylomirabilis sp.]|nr:nuclear transport factor 2 family protein [Candidatus Methylomirabilis sp.]
MLTRQPSKSLCLGGTLLILAVLLLCLAAAPRLAAQAVTVETLRQFVAVFNRHDLDAVMSFFADDRVLEMPRGPDPWGRRYVGKAEARKGLATRFEGLPDVHYPDDEHCIFGDHAVSQWTLTSTTKEGRKIRVRGCDLLQFRNGKIIRKDSYWKIVE